MTPTPPDILQRLLNLDFCGDEVVRMPPDDDPEVIVIDAIDEIKRIRASSTTIPILGHISRSGIHMHTDPTPVPPDSIAFPHPTPTDTDTDDLADIRATTNPVDVALRTVAHQLLRENTALRRRLQEMHQLIGELSERAIRDGRVVFEAPDFDATGEYDTLDDLMADIQESVEHDGSKLPIPYDVYIRRITVTQEHYMRFRAGQLSQTITPEEAGKAYREASE